MENFVPSLKVGDWVIFNDPYYKDHRSATGQIHEILGGNRASVRWDLESDPMSGICSLNNLVLWNK